MTATPDGNAPEDRATMVSSERIASVYHRLSKRDPRFRGDDIVFWIVTQGHLKMPDQVFIESKKSEFVLV